MERELTESDKPELLNLLSKVSDKWKRLGVQLELSNTLSTITEGDPRNSMMEMITEWLKGNGKPPTPKALADVLKSDSVGERKLAESVEKMYGKTAEMESVTEGQSAPGLEMAHPSTAKHTQTPSEKPGQAGITQTANKRKPKQDTREVESPAEILYKTCQDHVFKCKECRERLLKTIADQQNNIPCKNAHDGCDWRGKSTEEQDAHTAICLKERIQCPFDEEFRCQQYFRREELNIHLQYHITSLHTQIKTCQCQTNEMRTFMIPEFQFSLDRCGIPKPYKFPFYTRQGGYLMRLCISVVKSPENGKRYIDLSVESMPGSYDDRLPRSSNVRITGLLYSSIKRSKSRQFDFKVDITRPTAGQSPKKCPIPMPKAPYEINYFYPQDVNGMECAVSGSEYFVVHMTIHQLHDFPD